MGQYFPEPYGRSGGNVTVELDLSYYTTVVDLKRATDTYTSTLVSKTDFG